MLGLLLATQEAVKHFGPAGGSIINISSVVATAAPPNASVYSATKAAVDAVTRSLAKELGPRKIRVNSINPGMVETEGVHAAGIAESDFRKQIEAQTPLGRIGQPRDIAPAAVFLASDDSAWITGETFYISGGIGRPWPAAPPGRLSEKCGEHGGNSRGCRTSGIALENSTSMAEKSSAKIGPPHSWRGVGQQRIEDRPVSRQAEDDDELVALPHLAVGLLDLEDAVAVDAASGRHG